MRRSVVIVAILALLAVSCGQYQNVHTQGVAAGETTSGGALTSGDTTSGDTTTGSGTTLPGSTDTTGSTGTTIPGTTGTGSTDTTTGSGSTGSTDTTGGTETGTGDTTGGSDASGPTPGPSGPGDATGVTATSITIGIHAPLTGAAPVKQTSFESGKDLYWKYGDNGQPVKIFGREVKVIFQDDHYNPSTAKTVCQQMAEEDHAFLLIGGAGTDQIVACAQYSAGQGIPYLSAGVTKTQLAHFSNYFAISSTYSDQTHLLADYIRNVLKITDQSKIAMVAEDTPNFDDAVAAFQQEFPQATAPFRPGKNDAGESMANNLCTGPVKKFDVVFPLVSPIYYLHLAHAAQCHPHYVGIGLTEGIDAVANIGCPDTSNAEFFNPSPAWHDRDKFDKTYETAVAAAKKDNPNFANDDIVWLLWGLMKTVGVMLKAAGPDLTRQGFISAAQTATVHSGVYPDLKFSPNNHFGTTQVHQLKNVCPESGGGYYVTERAFVNGF
ncbi:MAG: ABC transporter substrate-binding protein [Actinomycetota bacterium]